MGMMVRMLVILVLCSSCIHLSLRNHSKDDVYSVRVAYEDLTWRGEVVDSER